jgi:hypothetical protein
VSFDPLIDPDETRDYTWDWSARLLGGETITSHTVTVTGCTLGSHTATTTKVTAWASAAIPGPASLTCHVVTSGGRTFDDTIRLTVMDL